MENLCIGLKRAVSSSHSFSPWENFLFFFLLQVYVFRFFWSWGVASSNLFKLWKWVDENSGFPHGMIWWVSFLSFFPCPFGRLRVGVEECICCMKKQSKLFASSHQIFVFLFTHKFGFFLCQFDGFPFFLSAQVQ